MPDSGEPWFDQYSHYLGTVNFSNKYIHVSAEAKTIERMIPTVDNSPPGDMKYDINNDLSKLSEWAKLRLVDFNPLKLKFMLSELVPHLDHKK